MHRLERRPVISDGTEDPARCENRGQIDLVDGAIRERETHPAPVERLDAGDGGACASHGRGATGRWMEAHPRTNRNARSGSPPRMTRLPVDDDC